MYNFIVDFIKLISLHMEKAKIYFLFFLIFFSKNIFSQNDITFEELQFHNQFLASDSLKGRFPGTKEDKIAANYIKNDLKKSGFELLGDAGFQYFDVVTGCGLTSGNYLKIENFSAKMWEDYIPLSYSSSSEFEGNIVFVGYGFAINKDSISWNDYENVDLTNKWALILRDLPDISISRDFFSLNADDRMKSITAQNNGAKGVILVSGYNSFKNDNLVDFKISRIKGNLDIPVVHISRNLAERIFENSEKNLQEIENTIKETEKPFSFEIEKNISANVNIEYYTVKTQNIIAKIEGSDEKLKNEFIILGAHYDHLGLGGKKSGSRMEDTIAIHNGADDNASGVASILEIAEKIASEKENLKRSIIIMAFGAEEQGLIGSAYFVNNPIIDLDSIALMVNIDMIGRYNDETGFNIMGVGTSSKFDSILNINLEKIDLKYNKSEDSYGGSDHVSFKNVEIPVLVFNTGGHSDYHTPFDDSDLIDYKSQTEISNIISSTIIELSKYEKKFDFAESKNDKNENEKSVLKVKLGIVPGFDDTSNKGLRVDGVNSNSPAKSGGIERGDYIIGINGMKIKNIYEYMNQLNTIEPNSTIEVEINRNNKIIVLELDLKN